VEGTESYPRFSPDGKWIAFGSNNDVYVAPFPGPGRRIQVSNGDGSLPRWRRDGKELFFIGPDLTITAAPVSAQGSTLLFNSSVPLFHIESVALGFYPYDVSIDGQRFLVNTLFSQPTTPPRQAIALNWPPRLH
jgi:hypothetical protein